MVAVLAKPRESGPLLVQEALSRGAGPSAFMSFEPTEAELYLHRLSRVDLSLDTRVWNGEGTALDALWEGAPQVSIAGGHMSNRFGASAANALLGESAFVVETLKGYEDAVAGTLH